MKEAFSMLEVIITVMIISVMIAVGTELIPNTSLSKDTSFILYKIKETQTNALLNQNKKNCISLDKKNYPLSIDKETQILIEGNLLKKKKLCFDDEGKPFDENLSIANLIKKPIFIKLKNNKEFKELIIMPFSGTVIVK